MFDILALKIIYFYISYNEDVKKLQNKTLFSRVCKTNSVVRQTMREVKKTFEENHRFCRRLNWVQRPPSHSALLSLTLYSLCECLSQMTRVGGRFQIRRQEKLRRTLHIYIFRCRNPHNINDLHIA
jgi:hypothetical protein